MGVAEIIDDGYRAFPYIMDTPVGWEIGVTFQRLKTAIGNDITGIHRQCGECGKEKETFVFHIVNNSLLSVICFSIAIGTEKVWIPLPQSGAAFQIFRVFMIGMTIGKNYI